MIKLKLFIRIWPALVPPRLPLPLLQPKPRSITSLSVPTLTLSYKDVYRISVLPFPAPVNKSDGTKQLTRSVRSATSDTAMCCDDHGIENARSPTWVTGWDYPLHLPFNSAITPDTPTTARMTTLIDDFFGRMPSAMVGGASGPETFTLLLRLLVTNFDRVDTVAGNTKLNTFESM